MTGISKMTIPDLATLASAGYDEHEAELHARLPYLRGWHDAMQALLTQHCDTFWEQQGGYDPWSELNPGQPGGYVTLERLYRESLQRLAAGEPRSAWT